MYQSPHFTRPTPIPSRKFNVTALQSPVFKVTLADENYAEYYIHKTILISLSLEMKNHVENAMREGIQGEMVLHQVDDETMQSFLEWAYVKEYTVKAHEETSILLTHMKLYVFADRFNITSLQDLCMSNLTSILPERDPFDEFSYRMATITAVVQVTDYAVENIPSLTDKAVNHLLHYLSDAIPHAINLTGVVELLEKHPDVENILMRVSSSPENEPLWKRRLSEQKWGLSRLITQCTKCDRLALMYRFECIASTLFSGCGYTLQCRYGGWFNQEVEHIKCPRCGGCLPPVCRKCWMITASL